MITDIVNSDCDPDNKVVRYLQDRKQQEDNAAAMKRVDEGYWRSNTIFPQTSHKGFIAIKKFKADNLIIDIPINGFVCHFEVLPKKYM